MHPAPSVIVFTTFSGLGFGLLMWLGIGIPAVSGWVAFVFFALAYLMAVGGLLASTFHLGRSERALKAFTQWRSSWLSREAWLAVLTLLTMAIYGGGLVFFESRLTLIGLIGAGLAFCTVFTTSMIYAQLRTVPRWNTPLTPVMFLSFSITGGALFAGQVSIACWLIIVLGLIQIASWATGDRAFYQSGTTLVTATGLGKVGAIRAFEPPHTGTNYLLNEFVYIVGRKHSLKLRVIALALMSVLPVGVLLAPFSHGLAAVAIISHITGVLVSRWLFFAEAEHVVGLYYGKR